MTGGRGLTTIAALALLLLLGGAAAAPCAWVLGAWSSAPSFASSPVTTTTTLTNVRLAPSQSEPFLPAWATTGLCTVEESASSYASAGGLDVPESGLSRGAQLRSQLGGLSRADRQARISALVSENQLRLQNLGRGASSRVLGRNLQAVGTLRPTGSAAHHIVAGRSLYAVSARRMLRRAGVDINEAANGVFLPRLRATRTLSPSAYHPSLHTRRYYTEVTRRLRGVRGRDEALEVLEQIRTDLLGGRFPN